ncbi:MAG: CoA transferase [Dehalococcoidia bacterium]|nr:CoA transferase [Dehalococcoidia bacterium]
MADQPLEGLLAIDLAGGVAGAYCCSLLAAAGAEVIKVEPPRKGHPLRYRAPFLKDIPAPENSALFLFLNAGKKSVTLDCEAEDGRALLRALVDKADALVEEAPPGYLASLGLTYDDLRRTNPRLVITSVTSHGPWDSRAAYRLDNLTLLAAAGRLNPDVGCGADEAAGHAAEYEAGLNAFAATLAGLLGVAVSERGQRVGVAGVECLAATSVLPKLSPRPAVAAAVPSVETEHPLAGRLAYPPLPFALEGVDYRQPAPLLGGDNAAVYGEMLGLTPDEIASLAAKEVI